MGLWFLCDIGFSSRVDAAPVHKDFLTRLIDGKELSLSDSTDFRCVIRLKHLGKTLTYECGSLQNLPYLIQLYGEPLLPVAIVTRDTAVVGLSGGENDDTVLTVFRNVVPSATIDYEAESRLLKTEVSISPALEPRLNIDLGSILNLALGSEDSTVTYQEHESGDIYIIHGKQSRLSVQLAATSSQITPYPFSRFLLESFASKGTVQIDLIPPAGRTAEPPNLAKKIRESKIPYRVLIPPREDAESGDLGQEIDKTTSRNANLKSRKRLDAFIRSSGFEPVTVPPQWQIEKPQDKAPALKKIQFPDGSSEIKVAVEKRGSALYLPVTINGAQVSWMRLDTGAVDSFLNMKTTDQLALGTTGRQRSRMSLTGPFNEEVRTLDSMIIGPLKIPWMTEIGAVNLPNQKENVTSDALRSAGTIGWDVLEHIPFQIDYFEPSVTFFDPDQFTPPDATVELDLRPRESSHLPVVQATLNDRDLTGINLNASIDTGADGGFYIKSSYLKAHWPGWLQQQPRATAQVRAIAAEPVDMQAFPLPLLTIANVVRGDLTGIAIPVANEDYLSVDALIGADFLLPYRTTFHLQDKKVYLDSHTVKSVENLIDSGWNPNKQDHDGSSALHLAAKIGATEIFRILLEAGAHPNPKDSSEFTPLEYAATLGNLDAVKLLSAAGAKVNAGRFAESALWSRNSVPLLQWLSAQGVDLPTIDGVLVNAARYGDLDAIRYLVDIGCQIDAPESGQLSTPLVHAVHHGYHAALRLLLELGAEPDVPYDKEGGTAVMQAAQQNDLESLQMFADGGADLNKATVNGASALLLAALGGHADIVNYLLSRGVEPLPDSAATDIHRNPLWLAAQEGHLDVVKILTAQGLSVTQTVNAKGDLQMIHSAAHHDHLEVLQFLIDAGADINARMADGTRPVDLACATANWGCVETLVNAGADVNSTNNDSKPPLAHAVASHHDRTVSTLLKSGADPSAPDPTDLRNTPLHIATINDDAVTIHLLTDAGADINATNEDDMTALHLAVRDRCMRSVRVLIELGADTESRDAIGQDARSYATFPKDPTILKLLDEAEAKKSKSLRNDFIEK